MREIMVVLTNAIPGSEDEFNEWYSDRHLGDVLALDGFVGAQRFEIATVDGAVTSAHRYLAIYEIQEGQAEAARRALAAARSSGTREST